MKRWTTEKERKNIPTSWVGDILNDHRLNFYPNLMYRLSKYDLTTLYLQGFSQWDYTTSSLENLYSEGRERPDCDQSLIESVNN